jgi:hypothetical protein
VIVLALLTILTNGVVVVPASRWTAIRVEVKEPHTAVECTFSVLDDASGIRAMLMTRVDAERFHAGRSNRPLYSTGFQRWAHFRYEVADPGEYVLLLDNRIEGRGPTNVELRVELEPAGSLQAKELPPRTRAVVIALGILFFIASVAFFVRQFLK